MNTETDTTPTTTSLATQLRTAELELAGLEEQLARLQGAANMASDQARSARTASGLPARPEPLSRPWSVSSS